MIDLRMTMVLGDAEAAALRLYAEHAGLSIRDAAHQLVMEGIRRDEQPKAEPRCRDCKWWASPDPYFSVCNRIGGRDVSLEPLAPTEAVIPDPSPIWIITGPDFGCTLFEAKP